MICVIEAIVPPVANPVYSAVYDATFAGDFPGAAFFITAGAMIVCIVAFMYKKIYFLRAQLHIASRKLYRRFIEASSKKRQRCFL